MKKILVIGEKSFVGDSFIEYIRKNYTDDYIVNNVSSLQDAWKEVDFGGYDAVYNVAGLAHVRAKKNMEELYYRVNRDMPVEICKKAKKDGCKQFVHMSSMIIYGEMSRVGVTNVIRDPSKTAPTNFYGDSKLQADRLLSQLAAEDFKVAIIRPPLIYSQNARDNFPRLMKLAKKLPFFPSLKNEQSMLYVYNLAELIRLIIEHHDGGFFYPQNREYTSTSAMVKSFADHFGNKMAVVGIFNPFLKLASFFVPFVNKAFGNLCYDTSLSGHYDWAYCKYSLEDSIRRTAKKVMNKTEDREELV